MPCAQPPPSPVLANVACSVAPVDQAHDHLERRADVDRPLDHPGQDVLARLPSCGVERHALGPHDDRDRAACADVAAAAAQRELADAHRAAAGLAGRSTSASIRFEAPRKSATKTVAGFS